MASSEHQHLTQLLYKIAPASGTRVYAGVTSNSPMLCLHDASLRGLTTPGIHVTELAFRTLLYCFRKTSRSRRLLVQTSPDMPAMLSKHSRTGISQQTNPIQEHLSRYSNNSSKPFNRPKHNTSTGLPHSYVFHRGIFPESMCLGETLSLIIVKLVTNYKC